jgi:hypothetical protein
MIEELHLKKFEDLDLDFLTWCMIKFDNFIEILEEEFDNTDNYELDSELSNGAHRYESKQFYQFVKEFLFKVQEIFEEAKQEYFNKDEN